MISAVKNDGTIGDSAKRQFGSAVRSQRQSMGLTQDALAIRMTELGCPMTQTTVAKIERGDRPTPVSEAAVFAYIFGVSIGSLLPSVDEESEEVAHKAELIAESRKLVRSITTEQHVLKNAAQRTLTAQGELRRLAVALGFDEAVGQMSGFGTLEKSIYYSLSLTDPVETTRKAVEDYQSSAKSWSNSSRVRLVLEVKDAQERASHGEHSETP